MLCVGLRCDEHTFPGLLTERGSTGLLCRRVCCNNVGDGGLEVDRQDNVNIWELILLDVAC